MVSPMMVESVRNVNVIVWLLRLLIRVDGIVWLVNVIMMSLSRIHRPLGWQFLFWYRELQDQPHAFKLDLRLSFIIMTVTAMTKTKKL